MEIPPLGKSDNGPVSETELVKVVSLSIVPSVADNQEVLGTLNDEKGMRLVVNGKNLEEESNVERPEGKKRPKFLYIILLLCVNAFLLSIFNLLSHHTLHYFPPMTMTSLRLGISIPFLFVTALCDGGLKELWNRRHEAILYRFFFTSDNIFWLYWCVCPPNWCILCQ